MASNEVVFGIITAVFALVTFIFSWFINNYQQKEDQIKKREKILDGLVIGFNGLDELYEGHAYNLFKGDLKQIEPIRLKMNFHFKLAISLARLYFLNTSDIEKWINCDNELDQHIIKILPKYTVDTKPTYDEYIADYSLLMGYLPKFIDLLKQAKFYNKFIIF